MPQIDPRQPLSPLPKTRPKPEHPQDPFEVLAQIPFRTSRLGFPGAYLTRLTDQVAHQRGDRALAGKGVPNLAWQKRVAVERSTKKKKRVTSQRNPSKNSLSSWLSNGHQKDTNWAPNPIWLKHPMFRPSVTAFGRVPAKATP